MAPPQYGSDAAVPPDDGHRTLVLSLIRIRGYREPGPDLLDEIVRDALAASDADANSPAAAITLEHLDQFVREAAANGRLQRA